MKRKNLFLGIFACCASALLPRAALADFCIGNGCAANREGWHCHSFNTRQGVECWDRLDNMCEMVAGFSRASEETISCGAASSIGGSGGVFSQLPQGFGGVNIFRNQIHQRPVARREAEGEEQESGDGFRFSEITTSLEGDSWDYRGVDGETIGLLVSWRSETENNHNFGASASYQEAEPDSGESTELLNANFSYGRGIGQAGLWKWAVSATVSDFSGFFEETLVGGGGQIYFNKSWDDGSVLSGGLVALYQSSDEFSDDIQTVGLGLAYGLPLGQRLVLDLEAYGSSLVEPEEFDSDVFYSLGGILSVYITQRFTLSFGYRILEGIDDLDSQTVTVGSSHRW